MRPIPIPIRDVLVCLGVLLFTMACSPGVGPGAGRREGGGPPAAIPHREPPLPDPLELLRAANDALLEARWLEFDFEYVATHATRGRIVGHAALEPVDRNLARSRFRIEANLDLPVAWLSDLPRRVLVAQDGVTAWRVDPVAGRVERATLAPAPGWSPAINLANVVLPVQPFRERPMGVEIDDPIEHRYAGTGAVGGVECDVVFLAFPPESGLGEQYFYLGREDHLPRRIVLTNVEETDMGPPMGFDLTLTELTAGSGPAPFEVEPEVAADIELVDRDLDSVEPGDLAPEWRLTGLDGRQVDSSDLRGSVVVLEFWATWCPTCRVTLPVLERVREELGALPVRVFAVHAWDTADPRPYLEAQGLDLDVLLGGDTLADRLKVYGTSQNVVIDPQGRIVLHDLLFPLAEREERLREAALAALAVGERAGAS